MAVVSTAADASFRNWLDALEQRHLAELTFAEVRSGLQSLSRWYVQRREADFRVRAGAALGGRGKRAAFALFYGPLHFLVVRAIVRESGLRRDGLTRILDLGCGTGAASAAWALEHDEPRPRLSGIDLNPWAVTETRWTWRSFGLGGSARRAELASARLPGRGAGILAAFVINELGQRERDALLPRLVDHARSGARVLVVEPIARRMVPWWESWSAAFACAGGRSDLWRFPARLPQRLRLLDRAAGLDHDELTARSLIL